MDSKELKYIQDTFFSETLSLSKLARMIEEQKDLFEQGPPSELTEGDISRTEISSLMSEIPDIPISELGFGDMTTSETGVTRSGAQRMALKRWTDKIRGNTLPKTLKSLADFTEQGLKFRAGTSPGGKIRTTLSYLAFYKTLTQILTGFNAASAGFTFEAFLAVLLGGAQIPTGNKTIADLTDGSGTYISLKLYSEAGVKVDGSWTDLVNDLADGPGYMHYVVVMKDLSGEGLEQQGTLKWYRFNFDLENVMSILSNTHKPDLLQLPVSFVQDPAEGDILSTLPQVEFSIEELENVFRDALEKKINNPDASSSLFERLQWATNPNIFAKLTSGQRVPGRSKIHQKQALQVIDDLIEKDQLVAEERKNVLRAVVESNNEVVAYQKTQAQRRSDAIANLKFATVEASVETYNSLKDPEQKKRALKNTRGYLYKGVWAQFHMSRTDVFNVQAYAAKTPGDLFPEGQSAVKLQEMKIGARYVIEMLQRSKAQVNNSVFEIISNVKILKTNLDQYFSGGLRNDDKAETAIESSQKIEGKTEELRPKGGEEGEQLGLDLE